jgi:glycosyltransferase involved in cell wall biosynthesis
MRIFQILEFNQFDTGSVHQMFQAAAGLRERGHEVTIVSRSGAALQSKAEEHGVRFESLPMRNAFDVVSARRLARMLRHADVVHVHKGVAHSLALMATLAQPVGAFVVNRGVSFPLDRWNRPKFRTRRVDRIVTVCEQIRGVIIESGGLPPEKVVVVYAGTDVEQFDPAKWDARAFRREKEIPDDRFLVAQAGVRDWKGWKELTDAIVTIPRVHLAFIGARKESERREVFDYARERGVADRATIVEVRADMPSVFASCDLVVDASWAGTGITGTIREAMAMQKPVITTDCGGNRELVSSPAVGWLIPPRNAAALTGAIIEVIDDAPRRARVAANAREHVARGFSKELRITKLEELYRVILSRPERSEGTAKDPETTER